LGYLEAVEWNTIALVTQIMIGCTTPTIANPNTIEVGFKPDFILARRMIATMTSSPRVGLPIVTATPKSSPTRHPSKVDRNPSQWIQQTS
jgi:hypothetical protein